MNHPNPQRRLQANHASRKTSRMAALLLSLLCAAWYTSTAQAQDVTCDGTEDFPCSFQSEAVSLQKVPAIFKFQSRISQAKLPLGEAVFETVFVKILRGTETVCQEQFAGVTVQNSTMNLEIGRNMNCELDEVIAENPSLSFQVCLGGQENCLRPLDLAASPYAIKSSFASQAQNAHQADIAGQAHYAHRITADRDLLLRNKLGTGYFDFYTHPAESVDALYNAADYLEYARSGFLQWTPTSPDGAFAVHIVAKDPQTDKLRMLDRFVVASNQSLFRGGVVVDAGGAQITGNSTIEGDTTIAGLLLMGHDPESLLGSTDRVTHGIDGQLQVTGATFVNQGGAHVIGDSDIQGRLAVGQADPTYQLDVSGDINFTGQLRRNGEILAVSGAQWEGNQNLDLYYEQGNIGINTQNPGFDLDVAGDINFSGQLRRNGEAVPLSPWVDEGARISFAGHVQAERFTSGSGSLFQDLQIGAEGTGFSRGTANIRNLGEQSGLRFFTNAGDAAALLSESGDFITAGSLQTNNITATGSANFSSLQTDTFTATGSANFSSLQTDTFTATGNVNFSSLQTNTFTATGNTFLGNTVLNATDFSFGNNAGRGDGGRALVHDSGDTLVLNYANDFSGGVNIGSTVRAPRVDVTGANFAILYGNNANVGGSTDSGLLFQRGGTNLYMMDDDGDFLVHDYVYADEYRSHSDARIKVIQGKSDSAKDLATLRNIEITDYLYKDQREKAKAPQKKLIAQQVKKVFPIAVSSNPGIVPDIFAESQKVTSKGERAYIELAQPHNLTLGEKVRIETKSGENLDLEVVEVLGKNEFAVHQSKALSSSVFVYGRHVDDFHSVDYDAVAMLNVSATQELARRLEDLQAEVEELRDTNAKLRQNFADLAQLREDLETVRATCAQE